MDTYIKKNFKQVLSHLYINPLEKCNLRCKICYTKKTSFILKEQEIMNFIKRYGKKVDLKVITFCGGEVFTLSYFPHLINELSDMGIFVQVITNGTIDEMVKIKNPNLVNLIVSIDGLEKFHDKNRGKGNFKKSTSFIKKAQLLNFHTEIFSIITKENIKNIPQFELFVKKELNNISITYHPRKPLTYLTNHPLSNETSKVKGFDFLSDRDLIYLMKTKKTFPSLTLGCYQISLMSDGKVYGCCEGFEPIGEITDTIDKLIKSLKSKIKPICLGCSQAEFVCGIKHIIDAISK